ncbi:MAG: MurR/RpiR family transcriptional regulator [Lachnospiraceae bacterium]|nr:MurR/RpiR family transcriptional regulator [Lachnospiraceae bacterium]
MNILGKMNQPHFFSNSEQTVITYITKHPEQFRTATVKELAQQTYTSASTVIRLYQKLGCKNYNEFRLDYFSAVESRDSISSIDVNFPFSKDDSFSTVIKNMRQLSVNAIDDTLSLINEQTFQKAVNMLDQALTITVYGVGSNQSLAFDFMMNLLRINKQVHLPMDHQQLVISAASSDPSTQVALIISYTGETFETLEYCRLLKQTKTPMICITNLGNNSISDLCDISLKIVTKEKMFSKIGTFSSKLSIMILLDILYSGIFQKNYDQNLSILLEKRKRTTLFRSKVPFLNENEFDNDQTKTQN